MPTLRRPRRNTSSSKTLDNAHKSCKIVLPPGKKPSLPSFSDKWHLKAAVISAVDLIKGIGICAGMQTFNVEGATGNVHTNYTGKAAEMGLYGELSPKPGDYDVLDRDRLAVLLCEGACWSDGNNSPADPCPLLLPTCCNATTFAPLPARTTERRRPKCVKLVTFFARLPMQLAPQPHCRFRTCLSSPFFSCSSSSQQPPPASIFGK